MCQQGKERRLGHITLALKLEFLPQHTTRALRLKEEEEVDPSLQMSSSKASSKHLLIPPIGLLLLQPELLMAPLYELLGEAIDLARATVVALLLLKPLQVATNVLMTGHFRRRNYRVPRRIVVGMALGLWHGYDMRRWPSATKEVVVLLLLVPLPSEIDVVSLAIFVVGWVEEVHGDWLGEGEGSGDVAADLFVEEGLDG